MTVDAPTTSPEFPRRPGGAGARDSALPLVGGDEERSATALCCEEEVAAVRLVADLAALVDAGLVAPVGERGAVRYGLANPDLPKA